MFKVHQSVFICDENGNVIAVGQIRSIENGAATVQVWNGYIPVSLAWLKPVE